MELIFLGYLTFLSGATTAATALEAIFMLGLLDARERNNIPLHHSQHNADSALLKSSLFNLGSQFISKPHLSKVIRLF